MNKLGSMLIVVALFFILCSGVGNIAGGKMGYQHETGNFEGVNGVNIFYQYWAVENPRAVMIVVHGFGEHSDRYVEMANHFTEMGISVYALDHRGHGKSEGPRWNPESFDYYIDDLKTYVEMVKGWEPGKDMFMLGHSLGGEIALKYCMLYPEDLKGLITSSPSVGNFQVLPIIGRIEVSMRMLKLLSPILKIGAKILPNMGMSGTQIDPQFLNHDPENYNAYANDPLVCHESMKLRFSSEAGKNILFLQANAQKLKVPCLIMSGSEDMLVPTGAVEHFYNNVQIEDKAFIRYDGFYHEIFNEVGREKVYEDVDAWLAPRLAT